MNWQLLLDLFLINIFFITYDIRRLLKFKVWHEVNHLTCLHLNFTVCKRGVTCKAFWGLTIWSTMLSSLFQKLCSFRDITNVCIWCFLFLDLWAFTTQNLQIMTDPVLRFLHNPYITINFFWCFTVLKPPLKTFALLKVALWVNPILWPVKVGLFIG